MKNVAVSVASFLCFCLLFSTSAHADIGNPTKEMLIAEAKKIAMYNIPLKRSIREVTNVTILRNQLSHEKLLKVIPGKRIPTKIGTVEFLVAVKDHFDPPLKPELEQYRFKIYCRYYYFVDVDGKARVRKLAASDKYEEL